ncbi:MAG: thiamine pyrophosphate-dependent enzyme [Anaerolineae bacterium]|nr:thiamine pyrophosphate-dependent enzyme [Anaerolineae bacterium]NUQ04801.1 pyruvate dehydrogenase (acetyl-transferring) E1 component subunit alpha [Anaerolineae bacterium]
MATNTRSLDKVTLLDWYRQIVLIRQFENRCDELYHQKKITGVYLHLYSGHEAVGVGAVAALGEDDHVLTGYRDHGIALARGVDAKPLMAEMMGKRTGVSGGKGGSMHLASRAHNFWGGYAIVAGHLSLATGIAFKERYMGTENVVLCLMGDGATNNGYFHESLNLSAVWNLPVVWLIENNFIGMGTRIEDSSGQPELVKRAVAYGMKQGPRIDGQNVIEVHEAISEAVAYARKKGPVLVEALTYRYKGHGVSDKQYDARDDLKRELDDWQAHKDPINILKDHLLAGFDGIEAELAKIDTEVHEIVEEAVRYAEASPVPTYEDLIRHIYVE